MKKNMLIFRITIISVISFFAINVSAQKTAEAFIAMLPPVPSNICSDSNNELKEKFSSKTNELLDLITQELDFRNGNNNASDEKRAQNKLIQTTAGNAGISANQLQELMAKGSADGEMSEEETNALANQILQGKHNVSLGEVKNLENMSESGQQAWGSAYSSEVKTDVMIDPENQQQKNVKNQKQFNTAKSYKYLNDSLTALETGFSRKFSAIDSLSETKTILKSIENVSDRIYKLQLTDNYTDGQLKTLNDELKKYQKQLCEFCTPKYMEVLDKYLLFTKLSIKAYNQLEQLNYESAKKQVGANLKLPDGTMALNAVKNYIERLSQSDKYYFSANN